MSEYAHLPLELLVLIFSSLDPQQVWVAELVCKQWCYAARADVPSFQSAMAQGFAGQTTHAAASIVVWAAERGYGDILEWAPKSKLKGSGTPAFNAAAKAGHVRSAKVVYEKVGVWTLSGIEGALKAGHDDLVMWALDTGWPCKTIRHPDIGACLLLVDVLSAMIQHGRSIPSRTSFEVGYAAGGKPPAYTFHWILASGYADEGALACGVLHGTPGPLKELVERGIVGCNCPDHECWYRTYKMDQSDDS